MQKVNWKDVAIRALKTFIEAVIPLIIAAMSGIDFSGTGSEIKSYIVATLISIIAAGLSAAWNGVIQPLLAPKKEE